ncbi:MAG: OB-fold domain-containing protein [Planctomycetota bacterium]|jgi:Holliday junction resolvasome RuvABC DNA-binding subunit
MTAGIEGKLVKLGANSTVVQVGPVGYEVMLPSYCVYALSDKTGIEIIPAFG